MDIYAEVQSSDPADLINSPFGGRYCGPIPPRRRISMHRAVALSYYSSQMETSPELFGGRFTFVNACENRVKVVRAAEISDDMCLSLHCSFVRDRYTGDRFCMLVYDNAAQEQVGCVHIANVSGCLSKGHAVHVPVYRRANATRSARVPRL